MDTFLPLFLAAADTAGHVAEAAGSGGIGEKIGDMAKTFGWDAPYFIAQCLHFLIVMTVLYIFAFKPLMKTMEERKEKIADGLKYAEDVKTKLYEAEEHHKAKLAEASAEAQKIITEARDNAAAYYEKQTQQAAAKAEDIVAKARAATELEKQKMLADVRQEVAQLVVETSEKVLSTKLSDADRSAYTEAATTELAGRN